MDSPSGNRPKSPLSIWTVTDGKVGMVNQALGLAEAVLDTRGGGTIIEKTICSKPPWAWLPPSLWPPGVDGIGSGSDSIDAPYPDLLIGCGRHAVGPALAIKRRSGGRTFIVHVQHPRVNPARYDLIVAPNHDRLSGDNVLPVTGAVHRVTRAKLDAARTAFSYMLGPLPRPRIAVLIGGNNRSFRLTDAIARKLAADLKRIAEETGAGLMVTASRRTGEENDALLRAELSGPNIHFWDNRGENPYFGFLAHADAVIATCDSVNMISESAATGAPVHIVALEGSDRKFSAFHEAMYSAGIARPFEGRLEQWNYPPLLEAERAAAEVLRRLEAAKI